MSDSLVTGLDFPFDIAVWGNDIYVVNLSTGIFSGNTMTVNLTGVTDVQKISVTLTDVTDTSAHVLPPTDVSANMLIGDTSANKIVSNFDVRQTRHQVGIPVTGINFREHVKPDGSITSTDVGQVRSRVGNSVPWLWTFTPKMSLMAYKQIGH